MGEEYFGKIDYNYKEAGIIPEKRVIVAENLHLFLHHLKFDKKGLDTLILKGAVTVGVCEVGMSKHGAVIHYDSKKAYRFNKEAENEWTDVLGQTAAGFDFSESD